MSFRLYGSFLAIQSRLSWNDYTSSSLYHSSLVNAFFVRSRSRSCSRTFRRFMQMWRNPRAKCGDRRIWLRSANFCWISVPTLLKRKNSSISLFSFLTYFRDLSVKSFLSSFKRKRFSKRTIRILAIQLLWIDFEKVASCEANRKKLLINSWKKLDNTFN